MPERRNPLSDGCRLSRIRGQELQRGAPRGERGLHLAAGRRGLGTLGQLLELGGVDETPAQRTGEERRAEFGAATRANLYCCCRRQVHARVVPIGRWEMACGPVMATVVRRFSFQASYNPMPMITMPMMFSKPARNGAAQAIARIRTTAINVGTSPVGALSAVSAGLGRCRCRGRDRRRRLVVGHRRFRHGLGGPFPEPLNDRRDVGGDDGQVGERHGQRLIPLAAAAVGPPADGAADAEPDDDGDEPEFVATDRCNRVVQCGTECRRDQPRPGRPDKAPSTGPFGHPRFDGVLTGFADGLPIDLVVRADQGAMTLRALRLRRGILELRLLELKPFSLGHGSPQLRRGALRAPGQKRTS